MGNTLILFAAAKCQAEIKQIRSALRSCPPARLSAAGQKLAGTRCQAIPRTPLATSLEHGQVDIVAAPRNTRQE